MNPIEGANLVDSTKTDLTDDERSRLAALHRYSILDTPPEPQFDRLVELAVRFFDLPMAMVSFVGEDRQWFKARHGTALRCPRSHVASRSVRSPSPGMA